MASVHIFTEIHPDQTIWQRMEFSTADNKLPDLMGEVSKKVLDLRDQGIQEALIKMGWTPPPTQVVSGNEHCTRCAGKRHNHPNRMCDEFEG